MTKWPLVFMLVSTPVFAMEWYEAYESGRKHIEKGDCAVGIPLMQEALKDHPKDDLRARPYGLITIEYIPHYYLAECAMKSGDLDAAARSFQAGDSGGVSRSKKSKEYAALKDQYQEKKKAEEEKEKGDVTVPVPTGGQTRDPQPSGGSDTTRQDEAARQRQLEVQRQTEIRKLLSDAQRALRAGSLQEARQLTWKVLNLDPQNATAVQILNEVQDREDAIARAAQEKRRKLQEVRESMLSGNLDEAEKLARQLQSQYPSDGEISRILNEIGQASRESQGQEILLRNTEKQVVVAFFSGHYEAVIQMVDLNEMKFRQSWRLPYYRGCAHASLAILNNVKREDHERLARQSFRRAKEISSGIPDNPYISPKILEIFRSS